MGLDRGFWSCVKRAAYLLFLGKLAGILGPDLINLRDSSAVDEVEYFYAIT